jgi:hypothetical protein
MEVNMELKIVFTIAMFIISGTLFFISHKYLRNK